MTHITMFKNRKTIDQKVLFIFNCHFKNTAITGEMLWGGKNKATAVDLWSLTYCTFNK